MVYELQLVDIVNFDYLLRIADTLLMFRPLVPTDGLHCRMST